MVERTEAGIVKAASMKPVWAMKAAFAMLRSRICHAGHKAISNAKKSFMRRPSDKTSPVDRIR
jgi:hypothetical protein